VLVALRRPAQGVSRQASISFANEAANSQLEMLIQGSSASDLKSRSPQQLDLTHSIIIGRRA
jgi:hypothetical protein